MYKKALILLSCSLVSLNVLSEDQALTCNSPGVISGATKSYAQQIAELTKPAQPGTAKEEVAPLKLERIKFVQVKTLASDEKERMHLCEALVSAHWPEKVTRTLDKKFLLKAGPDQVMLMRMDDGSLAHLTQFRFMMTPKGGGFLMDLKPAEPVVALFMTGLASSYYKR